MGNPIDQLNVKNKTKTKTTQFALFCFRYFDILIESHFVPALGCINFNFVFRNKKEPETETKIK